MTARFMLDTDSISFALRGYGGVAERILEHGRSEICVSAVTVAELRYGAERRKSRKLHRLIDAVTKDVAVVAFDEACALRYGQIANELAARGTPVGELDVMIAAHALTLELTMVTHNVKHFGRIRGLKVEDWV